MKSFDTLKNEDDILETFNVLKEESEEAARSEEHTSELQSHSFISYAVFCLKKKKKNNRNKYHEQ